MHVSALTWGILLNFHTKPRSHPQPNPTALEGITGNKQAAVQRELFLNVPNLPLQKLFKWTTKAQAQRPFGRLPLSGGGPAPQTPVEDCTEDTGTISSPVALRAWTSTPLLGHIHLATRAPKGCRHALHPPRAPAEMAVHRARAGTDT